MKFTRYPLVIRSQKNQTYRWNIVPHCPLNIAVCRMQNYARHDFLSHWCYWFADNDFAPHRRKTKDTVFLNETITDLYGVTVRLVDEP